MGLIDGVSPFDCLIGWVLIGGFVAGLMSWFVYLDLIELVLMMRFG